MLKKIKKNSEIFSLGALILITVIFTTYYNFTKSKITNNYKEILNNLYFKKSVNYFFENLEPRFKKISHQISAGDTLSSVLETYAISKDEIESIKKKLSKKINLNKLNTSQKFHFTIDQSQNTIEEFVFQISNKERILLTRNSEKSKFNEEIILTKLNKRILYKENIILQSLYKSAIDQKIPASTIIEFARIYGFQVDFQRDIRKKDRFQIMYEVFVNENKKVIETGNIIFANLVLSGENNSLYYFDKKGSVGHYDKNGKSIKKALMKTPINGARLSSPFGMRKHPIDGFNKMHKGTDFAAPMGTPIMASGSGVVKKAG